MITLLIRPVGHHQLTEPGVHAAVRFAEASLGGVAAFKYLVTGLGELPPCDGLPSGWWGGGGGRSQGSRGADVLGGVLLLLSQLKVGR